MGTLFVFLKEVIMEKAVVVIPTYNESDNLQALVDSILRQHPSLQILVVDDNSPDGTGELADRIAMAEPRLTVMHRPGKMGLGSAYCDGFRRALESGAEYIIEMDADFSHDPSVLPLFLDKITDNDLVIGSRYLNGISVVNWPLRRLMLSYGANVYTRMITGLKIMDCTSGFKCFRRSLLERIDLSKVRSDGYSFQIEMNFRCHQLGARIAEVPIIFIDRRAGSSKMSKKIVREAVLMVWQLKIGAILRQVFRR
jgi:dolichol-phosphate mannosyltransferase